MLLVLAMGLFALPAARPVQAQGVATPALQSAPAVIRVAPVTAMPFTLLERGRSSSNRLRVAMGREEPAMLAAPEVLRFTDAAAWDKFWAATHVAPRPPAPVINFRLHMVLVVLGGPGTADVRLLSLLHHHKGLVANVGGIIWRDLARPGQVTWQAVLCYRHDGTLDVREDGVSRAFNRLVLREPTWRWLPDGRRRDLTGASLARLRETFHVHGERYLADLWRLQTSAPRGGYIPYSKLLEARLLAEVVGRPIPARERYLEVAHRFPGTECARLARHQLSLLSRRDMDQQSGAALDALRRTSAAQPMRPGDGKRWLEMAGLYENLLTSRPESLLAAVDCYRRAAADKSDVDASRNALLRAADICALYLNRPVAMAFWWDCVSRWPDGPCVGTVLARMERLQLEMDPSRAGQAFRRYLKAFPNAVQASEVRRLLAGPR